jgi:mannose-6-phosphate isomerase
MADLYPLLLIPEFDERPWGTRDLAPIYSKVVGKNPIGESWLTGEECRVANGPLSGQKVRELATTYGADLIGEAAQIPNRFPLLIKFLFPRDKLSVQVHPDDAAAREIGEPCGKTECWYVYKAMPGAQIALGLKDGVTRDQLRRGIEEKRAEDLVNWIDIHTGEMIYVDAGTVHAIGPGSILVETQQTSDTTYRLYDYGRPRELHIENGLKVTKERTHAGKVAPVQDGDITRVIAAPNFIVEKISLREPQQYVSPSSGKRTVRILVGLEGGGVVQSPGSQPVTFTKGEAVVIPAAISEFELRPQWTLDFMRMSLPLTDVPVPGTTLV